MRIVCLIENTTSREDLGYEHGLSLYIETGNHRILFDAGQSGAFADHAEKLGIDLSKVDFAILSHGHYDHGGGLRRFLELNNTAPVYVNVHAFGRHYNASQKYIGLDPALNDSGRLVYVDDCLKIAEGITLYPAKTVDCVYPIDSFGLCKMVDGQLVPDDFLHEQYLLIEEQGRRFCFSGCSHRGILNITHYFQPDYLFGGFHFSKLGTDGHDAAVLEDSARKLLDYPTIYYTGHCTGTLQYAFMKAFMKTRLNDISTGIAFIR